MFRGVNSVNLDAKGRMAMPTRYRDRLEELCRGQLVVTIDPDERCLLIYPLLEWETIQRKLETLSSFNPVSRRIQRLLMGHATDIELDSSGRLLLTPPLREYAQLDKKTVLLGQGNKFELWSEACWMACRDAYMEKVTVTEELPDELKTFSL